MTGSGTLADPYVIWDVNDLQAMQADLTAYYELGQDIDASATIGWNGGAGFLPIGRNSPYFTGHFDGKDYTISALTINRLGEDYTGLFGIISGATIQNVNLVSASIKGNDFTAALMALGLGGGNSISNCHASGTVIGNDVVGGLLGSTGYDYPTTNISDCSCSCSVTSDRVVPAFNSVGGLIADAGYVYIVRCYSTGEVIGVGENIGGFIGRLSEGLIEMCFATGNVSTVNHDGYSFCGGFVGYGDGTINDCYARGSVTATGDYVGGFSGVSEDQTNCYSTGAVSGVGSNVGGFNGEEGGVTTDCFWDMETSGWTTSFGGTGKTTAEMKTVTTFTDAGWDFTTIWDRFGHCNDGYPCLQGVTPLCYSMAPTRKGNILIDQLIYQHAERMRR